MAHMCNLETENSRNEEGLLEILYSERQFLEEHLKGLVVDQMVNGIKGELCFYNDDELTDGEKFYKKSIALLDAFILSEINYLNEKIKEFESRLGTAEEIDNEIPIVNPGGPYEGFTGRLIEF